MCCAAIRGTIGFARHLPVLAPVRQRQPAHRQAQVQLALVRARQLVPVRVQVQQQHYDGAKRIYY